jgi:hypothetical protein
MSTRQQSEAVEPEHHPRAGELPAKANPQRAAEPGWPRSEGRPIAFLLDASSALERRLLTRWIERHCPADVKPGCYEMIAIPASRRRRRKRALDPHLEDALASDTDSLFAPLRVAWLPPLRDGVRQVRFSDLLPYRGLFPSPPLFDRMPTYRTQGKRSLNFLSATR